MTFTTAFLAASLVVPSMPPLECDDCEVVTNCVFDASQGDAKEFAVRIELDATPSNGRGQPDPNLRVECSVENIPLFIRIR